MSTSVREAKWWSECVQSLRSDPLEIIAARFKVATEELCAALAEEGAGQAAERTPWWPEAMRMRATASLREIARRFLTEPRRIRRALARLNLRVGGRDIADDAGVAQLAGLRDVLGREPDAIVARMGKVIPEAVQGERKRLNIPAYVQRRRVRLSREDEAWIRGPKRGRRAKVHVEENLQVVRRPTRTDENAHRPTGWGVGHADPRPRFTGEAPFRPPRIDRDFFWSQGAEEMEKLLQPVRQRDGRQRIVRSEPPRPLAPESLSRPPVAPAAPPTRPTGLPSVVRRAPSAPVSNAPPLDTRAPAQMPLSIPPAGDLPSLPPVRPTPRTAPRPVMAAAGSATPAHTPAADLEWLVYVPGNETPLRVYAPDIVQAISAAGRIVPPDLLRLASVWRADDTQ